MYVNILCTFINNYVPNQYIPIYLYNIVKRTLYCCLCEDDGAMVSYKTKWYIIEAKDMTITSTICFRIFFLLLTAFNVVSRYVMGFYIIRLYKHMSLYNTKGKLTR